MDARTEAIAATAALLAAASALGGEQFDRACADTKANLRRQLAMMGFTGQQLEDEYAGFMKEALTGASQILLAAGPARGSA